MSKFEFSIETIVGSAVKIPGVEIDRKDFLTKQLHNKVSSEMLLDALENGTVNAKIPDEILEHLAKNAIKLETTKVTTISAAAGIPGGFAMIGTVPADVIQFYAHVFRITQKLAYIYGWKDLKTVDDEMEHLLTLFLGVVSGVALAETALLRVAMQNAPKIGAGIAAKPLTKTALYPILKKVVAALGGRLTKVAVGKTVTKVVPLVGGAVSGGVTVATFLPMANKLKAHLSKWTKMTADDFVEILKDDIIVDDATEDDRDS